MEKDKALRLIGLANRAGKVITGIELCEKAVKTKKAKLVVITKDTAESTADIFKKADVPVILVESKEKLGSFTGKDIRSVAVVTDKNFADAIVKESEELV